VGPRDRCAAFRWQDDLISAACIESGDGVDRLRTLYSVSFAVSVKGFVETGSSLDNGCGRSHLNGRGNTAPEHGRSGWHIQIGRAMSPSGWHRLPVRTGYHGTTTRDSSPEQAGSAGGLAEISFGSQQRQREITRCALSVEGSESATVIRSTSVVLSWITLSEGLMATLTLGLLGH